MSGAGMTPSCLGLRTKAWSVCGSRRTARLSPSAARDTKSRAQDRGRTHRRVFPVRIGGSSGQQRIPREGDIDLTEVDALYTENQLWEKVFTSDR